MLLLTAAVAQVSVKMPTLVATSERMATELTAAFLSSVLVSHVNLQHTVNFCCTNAAHPPFLLQNLPLCNNILLFSREWTPFAVINVRPFRFHLFALSVAFPLWPITWPNLTPSTGETSKCLGLSLQKALVCRLNSRPGGCLVVQMLLLFLKCAHPLYL